MIKVVGIGAGGHARVVLNIVQLMGDYEVVGLLDPNCVGQKFAGLPVLGGDELLPELFSQGITSAFLGVGSLGNSPYRRQLFEKVLAQGFKFINAIHPSSVIASDVQLGRGVAVMAGALINPNARIGDNVIINTGAIVEHDCVVEAHAHISPGAVLCGTVHVGSGAHVGAGSTVRQCITIGENSVVAAGAVVIKDVAPNTLVQGVPARPVK